MATIIQLRRGSYTNFDPQKMKPGELAVVQSNDPVGDGKALYFCVSAGVVKRLASFEDIVSAVQDATNEVAEMFIEQVSDDVERAEAAAESVEQEAQQIDTNTQDIADLKSDLTHIDDVLIISSHDTSLWESGGINLTDGQDYETNTRIRTEYISRDIAMIIPASGYQIGVYVYNSSDVFLGMYNGIDYSTITPHWYSSNAYLTEIPSGYNVRILARKESNESIAPSDATNILFGTYLDTSLTMSGKAADAKAVGDRLNDLEEEIDNIEPLSNEIKEALLECFEHVVWTDHDEDYYQALREALYASDLVVSINAVFTQGSTVIYPDESLDNLRSMLVVTGLYEDSSIRTITGYTLSGTLVGGTTSTITVSYQGKTTTFNVVVTDYEWGSDYTWLYRADEDGLLSANSNVSDVVTIGSALADETLVNGVLNLALGYNGQNHGSIFELIPSTVTSAAIKIKVKFNVLPISSPGGGMRLQVSNGTNGAQLFVSRYSNNPSQPKISLFEGSTSVSLGDVALNRWYVITCELSNNSQIIKLDDTVYRPSALSTYANTKTRLIALQPDNSVSEDPSNLNFDIAWIAFKNNSN